MFKTAETTIENNLTVDINGLQKLLSLGKGSADQIGREAGAIIHVGRRKLYLVPRVKKYLETMAGEQK